MSSKGYDNLLLGRSVQSAGGAITFLLLWSLSGALAGTVDDIRARGSLRVGTSGDYQPFSLCQEQGESCEGFDVDVARRLATDLGVRLEIVRFRWPELRTDLAAGKFDIAMSGVTMRPERTLTGIFTHPYLVSRAVVLVADKDRFSSLAAVDQAGVRLAVNAGGHLEQVARSSFPQATILPTPKNRALPDQVEKQQADALLTDSVEAPHFLATHPGLHALPGFGRDRKAYLLRREDVALCDWLDSWLIAHEHDVLSTLRSRWLGADSEGPSAESSLLAFMDLRLALMPAVVEYKHRHNLPVEDSLQENAIARQALVQAQGTGLDGAIVQELFRVQIELAKQVQRAVLQGEVVIPTWAHGLDLTEDLRPALVTVGNQIVRGLASLSPHLKDRDLTLRVTEEEITTPGVTAAGKRRLGEALWEVRRQAGHF
jgi:cyclohexadienyl dehydratase